MMLGLMATRPPGETDEDGPDEEKLEQQRIGQGVRQKQECRGPGIGPGLRAQPPGSSQIKQNDRETPFAPEPIFHV